MSETEMTKTRKPPSNRKRYLIASGLVLFSVLYLALMRMLSAFGLFQSMSEVGAELFSALAMQLLGFAIIPILVIGLTERLRPRALARELGFRKVSWLTVLISVLIGVSGFGVTIFISYMNTLWLLGVGFMMPRSLPGDPVTTLGIFLLSVFTTAITPGFCEEVADRAITGRMLAHDSKPRGDFMKILLIALFFGLFHGNVMQTVYTFFAGFTMGLLFVKTKSIFPSMIVHFVNNFMSVYLDYASSAGLPFGDTFAFIQNSFLTGEIIFVLLALLVAAAVETLCLIFIWRRYSAKNLKTRLKTDKTEYNPYTGRAEFVRLPVKDEDKIRPQDRIFFICALILGTLVTFGTLLSGML
ncbi:MAG: CPBP family intramembrane metalloprotease [Clostridiales bacterium]|jgi:membrane protease YdiL (CAAX protease family)|nr:CPBP family intramembrane metalloprotease [Clostridiales bacterium]